MKPKLLLVAALIIGAVLTRVTPAIAQYPTCLASSADGHQIIGGFYSGAVSISTDFGHTWSPYAVPNANWSAVASSADGSVLFAAINGGGIYVSTNSGTTWNLSDAPTEMWGAMAASEDGIKVIAATTLGGGPIYTSTNAGSTWASNSLPSLTWASVASSADGLKLVAVAGNGIYTSTNAGATWATNNSTGSFWMGVASSADGTRLVAVDASYGGGGYDSADGIWISTNSGETWTKTDAPIEFWESVASSATGTRLAATSLGAIYVSSDAGSTWTQIGSGFTGDWHSITSSADGGVIVAADGFSGSTFVKYSTPAQHLTVATANGDLVLSWLVPSINLALEQTTNLLTPNWTIVPTAPTLTNLQYQTILSTTAINTFFRLSPKGP
ncbi:MAG TPA: hypothetical protein VGO67_02570 [Verrucomicrobiae bacterium]|jgi:hypothetical protein